MIAPAARERIEPIIQVTEEDMPETMVHSYRGHITNLRWSQLEADGLARAGISAYVRQNGGDRIAVFRGTPGVHIKVIYRPQVNRKPAGENHAE